MNRTWHFFIVNHPKEFIDCFLLIFQHFVQGISLVPRLVHNEHASGIVKINRMTWFAVHSLWHQNSMLVVVLSLLLESRINKDLIKELFQQ